MTAALTSVTGGNVEKSELARSTFPPYIVILLVTLSASTLTISITGFIHVFLQIAEANNLPASAYNIAMNENISNTASLFSVLFCIAGGAAFILASKINKKVASWILIGTLSSMLAFLITFSVLIVSMATSQENFTQWANQNYGLVIDQNPVLEKYGMQDGLILTYNEKAGAATLHKDGSKWLLYDIQNENPLPEKAKSS